MDSSIPPNRIYSDQYLEEPPNEAHSQLEEYYRTTKRVVEENPLVATLAVFGVGFAVGSVLGGLLADSTPGFTRRQSMSERLRDRISSAIADVVPEFVERKFQG